MSFNDLQSWAAGSKSVPEKQCLMFYYRASSQSKLCWLISLKWSSRALILQVFFLTPALYKPDTITDKSSIWLKRKCFFIQPSFFSLSGRSYSFVFLKNYSPDNESERSFVSKRSECFWIVWRCLEGILNIFKKGCIQPERHNPGHKVCTSLATSLVAACWTRCSECGVITDGGIWQSGD